MIGIFSISKWAHYSGRATSSGKSWILNTENMFNVQTRATTKTKLFYTDNRNDRKKLAKVMNLEDAKAVVLLVFDKTYASNVITLPVFDNNLSTNSTTDRSFPVDSITRGTAYTADTDLSWLWYNEGGGREIKILVNYTLQEIVDIADSGTTSTS